MSVCSQWAYVIQVDHLEWILRGTCEGMRFDLNLQATHYLAAWALNVQVTWITHYRMNVLIIRSVTEGSLSLALHLA